MIIGFNFFNIFINSLDRKSKSELMKFAMDLKLKGTVNTEENWDIVQEEDHKEMEAIEIGSRLIV